MTPLLALALLLRTTPPQEPPPIRGSDAWFHAASLRARELHTEWQPDELLALGKDVMSAVMGRAGGSDGEPFDPLADLAPPAAGHALEVYVYWAHALQSRGEHESAVNVLTPVPHGVLHRAGPHATGIVRAAGIDLALSQLALGREADARRTLTGMRQEFAGTSAGARASAILDALDPDTKPEALAAAGARVEEALDCEVPGVLVGHAPRTPEHFGELAATFVDPRRPLPAIVVLFDDPEQHAARDATEVLAHELAHAAVAREVGLAYERLPGWAREGISNAVAGEFPDLVVRFLLHHYQARPDAFLAAADEYLAPVFATPDGRPSAESGLALLLLVERGGLTAIRQLIGALSDGRSLSQALEQASGMALDPYLEAAYLHASRAILTERDRALDDLRALVEVREEPERLRAAARRILAGDASTLAKQLAREALEQTDR